MKRKILISSAIMIFMVSIVVFVILISKNSKENNRENSKLKYGRYEFEISNNDTLIFVSGSENIESVIKEGEQYFLKELQEKSNIIEWNYDLTGNGINEKILVNTDSISNDVTNTVEVYSGESGKLIWNKHISLVHSDRLSISLYKKNDKYYILTWNPAVWQGNSTFRYKIFSLTEDGKELELEADEITFDTYRCNEEDIKKVIEFSHEVNSKFGDSFLLVSTVNTMLYSIADNIEKECFQHEALVGTMATNFYMN